VGAVLVFVAIRGLRPPHRRGEDNLLLVGNADRDLIRRAIADLVAAAEKEIAASDPHRCTAPPETVRKMLVPRNDEDMLAELAKHLFEDHRVVPQRSDLHAKPAGQ